MNTFPAEVFNQVVAYLDQVQKVECMLVCRNWENIIGSYNLFHTVRLTSAEGFYQLTKRIQKEPKLGKQLERLILHFTLPKCIDITNIFSPFPNLQVFYHLKLQYYENLETMTSQCLQRTTETVTELYSIDTVKSLLLSSVCPNLNVISIDCSGFDSKDILSLFANAPALNKLRLTDICITTESLEMLHRNAPHLRSIQFYQSELSSFEVLDIIEPASSVTFFKIEYLPLKHIDLQTQLLQYITKKYPNVASVLIQTSYSDIKRDELKHNYNIGWIPLFQNLRSQLTTLDIVQGAPPNLFQILDDAGCQIRKLYLKTNYLRVLLPGFGQSKQIEYIQFLSLETTKMVPENFEWLRKLLNLKKLKLISLSIIPIRLNHLLESCLDSVESVSIKGSKLDFDPSTTRVFNIKRLSISLIYLPERFGSFLSDHLPKLNTLKLKNCTVSGRRLIMRHSDLYNFTMVDFESKDKANLLVETIKEGKTQWYSTNGKIPQDEMYTKAFNIKDESAYPSIKIIPYEQLNTRPLLTLVCNSVVNISMIIS